MVYKDGSHGLLITEKDELNVDLLVFLKSARLRVRWRREDRERRDGSPRGGGGVEPPPLAEFTQRRTPRLRLFRVARHGLAAKVWDETVSRNLPEPEAGHHRCRWSPRGRPASTILKPRCACDPKAAAVCDPLGGRAPVHRASRALGESHRRQRPRRYRAGATRERSRPPGHPKSTMPGPPSFPPWSASDRS